MRRSKICIFITRLTGNHGNLLIQCKHRGSDCDSTRLREWNSGSQDNTSRVQVANTPTIIYQFPLFVAYY